MAAFAPIPALLTAKRDAAGAGRFFRRALRATGNPVPRVINVDKNPAYPAAVEALKAEGFLPRRVRLRQCKYLNNVVEQDHRTVKKRVWLAKGCELSGRLRTSAVRGGIQGADSSGSSV